jgi:hypothetical protein
MNHDERVATKLPTTSRIRHLLRGALLALLVAGTLVVGSSDAYAQKKKKAEEAPKKSYVFAYTVTMTMVSLGLMTVCRPGKRKERPDELKEDLSQ